MKLRPLFDRMVVEIQKEDTTKGGIILPDDVEIEPIVVKLLRKGEGAIVGGHVVPMPFEVGDLLIVNKGDVDRMTIHGETYYGVRLTSVLGVLEP